MAKTPSANRQRASLSLPNGTLKGLNEISTGAGTAIDQALRRIEEQLESQAGLRGEVGISDHVQMQGNSVTGLGRATEGDHAITFGQLREFSTCKYLTDTLYECSDYREHIQGIVEDFGFTPTVPITFFWGHHVVAPDSNLVTWTANKVAAYNFILPWSATITKLTFKVTTLAAGKFANFGLYDSGKRKILESGPQSVGATGLFTVTLSTPVSIDPGSYYFAATSDGTPVFRGGSVSGTSQLLNVTTVRVGLDTNSAAAALPSTLGTLSGTAPDPPLVLFES